MRCCILFCAFIPSMLLTHMLDMMSEKSAIVIIPMKHIAHIRSPSTSCAATSMAWRMAYTVSSDIVTSRMPMMALSVVCSLFPFATFHSQHIIDGMDFWVILFMR